MDTHEEEITTLKKVFERSIHQRASADPRFRRLLIQLSSLKDKFVYPNFEAEMEYFKLTGEVLAETGLLDRIHNQEQLSLFNDWLLDNINELAYSTQYQNKWGDGFQAEGTGYGRRYSGRIGRVFLSWTVKNPRSRETLIGIMEALDYFNIEYINYMDHLADDQESDEQTAMRLKEQVNGSSITIESYSSGVGSKWIQIERYYIKQSPVTLRIIVFLESEIGSIVTMGPSEENRIIRWDMSGGRLGIHSPSDEKWRIAESDTTYYKSSDFLVGCFELAWAIRKRLEELERAPSWSQSFWEGILDTISFRKNRELAEFLHYAIRE
jgi:hypothetical protein